MRDRFAHRYFDASPDVIADTVAHDLPQLLAAVARLRRRVADD